MVVCERGKGGEKRREEYPTSVPRGPVNYVKEILPVCRHGMYALLLCFAQTYVQFVYRDLGIYTHWSTFVCLLTADGIKWSHWESVWKRCRVHFLSLFSAVFLC